MRPDRIVLGECRGAEVREVLTALNTGHEGSCATIHANTAKDVPARLAALGALAGMDAAAVAAQSIAAIGAIVHMSRFTAGRRGVAEIAALVERQPGVLASVTAVQVIDGRSMAEGPGWQQLAERSGW
jgi:pilus assembly protein CpaF